MTLHSLEIGKTSRLWADPNVLALTKPAPFGHLEIDLLDLWERLGKEVKTTKGELNCTESTGRLIYS